jgi:HEAT repeat protein
MSEFQEQFEKSPPPADAESGQEKSRWATLAVQLVVIPLAVVVFCVLLGGTFMWLTSERRDLGDYIQALRSNSGEARGQQAQFLLNYIQESKRWQGIFDVTARMSADPEQFLQRHPDAVRQLAEVFEQSRDTDPRTRRYLALALGLLGQAEAAPVLRAGLDDRDDETVKNCLWALSQLGDHPSAARAIELTRHDDYGVRLTAVYALGALEHPQGRQILLAMLNETVDVLMQWNAAFGLASKGDRACLPVLERLLDKEYVDGFVRSLPPERRPTPQNIQRYRVAAVMYVAQLEGDGALPRLEQLAASDPDLQVRNAALHQAQELRQGL